MRISADRGVKAGYAFYRVNHQQGDVSGLKMFARHHHRKFFRHQVGLAFAADSSSVNKPVGMAIFFNQLINGVARSACNRRNDSTRTAGEYVEQRRFANVWMAYDRYLGFFFLFVGSLSL